MINNWYKRVAENQTGVDFSQNCGFQFQNPIQKAQYIMQAMMNPASFVKQCFPDIPNDIANDPNQILQYLKNTRGITDQQIQQLVNQYPRRF